MKRWILGCLASGLMACSLFSLGRTNAPAQAQAPVGEPGIVPGLTEIAVAPSEDGAALSIVLYAHGPVEGVATLTLVKDEEKLGSFFKLLEAGPDGYFPMGDGQLVGNRFGSLGPDFRVSEPGRYTLRLDLDDTVREEHFELVSIATTSGHELGLDPQVQLSRAALRFVSELYGEPKADGDRFWITLPTDLRLETTRVGLLFFHGQELRGRVTQDIAVGPVGLHTPLRFPLRVWGWPDDLPRNDVLASAGRWTVVVVQDGRTVTACPFEVEGGRYVGPAGWSRSLACGPELAPGGADAIATEIGGFAPEGMRAREVVALHRSPEARRLKEQIAASAQASVATLGQSHEAAEHAEEWGDAGWESGRRAWKAEEKRKRESVHAIDRERSQIVETYRRLVRKFPEGGPLPE